MERTEFTFSLLLDPRGHVKSSYISKTIYLTLPSLSPALLISETLWKLKFNPLQRKKPTHLGLCCVRVKNTERFYSHWPAKGHYSCTVMNSTLNVNVLFCFLISNFLFIIAIHSQKRLTSLQEIYFSICRMLIQLT